MCEMTAEVADGILVMPFNSGRHFRERTMPAIERGLATGGRTADEFEIVVEAIMAVGETDEQLEAASKGVRGLLSFYGSTPSYKPVLDVEGWGDVQPELNAMSKRGEWAQDARPHHRSDGRHDRGLRHPAEAASELVERFGEHADRACLYFPGYEMSDERLARLVDEIRRAVG